MLWLLSEPAVTVKSFLPESCLPCCSKKHGVCQLLNEIRWVPGCPHIQHSQNTLMRVSASHLFSRYKMPFTKNWAYYNKNRCIIKVLGDHMHMTAPLKCYKHSEKSQQTFIPCQSPHWSGFAGTFALHVGTLFLPRRLCCLLFNGNNLCACTQMCAQSAHIWTQKIAHKNHFDWCNNSVFLLHSRKTQYCKVYHEANCITCKQGVENILIHCIHYSHPDCLFPWCVYFFPSLFLHSSLSDPLTFCLLVETSEFLWAQRLPVCS